MRPFFASLINAFVLILLGLWGYFFTPAPSITALIPVAIGLILLMLNRGLRKEHKVISHIAVVITALTLVALIKPLSGAIGRSDSAAIARVSIMMASTLLALVYFVKSFADVRSGRDKGDQDTIT